MPFHWGINGEPDGFAPAIVVFLFGPVLTAGLVALLAVIPRIEPRREHMARSASAYRTVMVAVIALLGLIQVVTVLAGTGVNVPMAAVIGAGVGILLAVIGNVMSTVRSTFLFGVRTPWTLTSERSWDKTNRLVGRLFVVTGIVTVITALTGRMELVLGVMLVMLVASVVGGFWYSYRVWKDDPDKRTMVGGRLIPERPARESRTAPVAGAVRGSRWLAGRPAPGSGPRPGPGAPCGAGSARPGPRCR